MDDSTAPVVPPIPRQTHQQSRHKNAHHLASLPLATSRGLTTAHGAAIPPASPEVISSLITSLSVLSKPSSTHFDGSPGLPHSPTFSTSGLPTPSGGSFGVDYGAFSTTTAAEVRDEDVSLDELAACPPVIRTAKPPSGFSPLTAPRSPNRDSSSGLKSILTGRNSSRPSSRSSGASRDADTQSIGNLSIERGAVSPVPELKRRSSHDSWGKKAGRSQKGLMYMSSKERLREREAERKRASVGAVGSERLSGTTSPRPDPFLGEVPISEESHTDSPNQKDPRTSMENGGQNSPRTIPNRDSSLRKVGSGSKRSSRRTSKQKGSDSVPGNDTIQELDENHLHRLTEGPSHHSDAGRRRSHQDRHERHEQYEPYEKHDKHDKHDKREKYERRDRHLESTAVDDLKMPSTRVNRQNSSTRPPAQRSFSLTNSSAKQLPEITQNAADDIEDGAPSPAVAQGRRRSGQLTPDLLDGKAKRNSSKLKRLSGSLSPRLDDKTSVTPDGFRKDRASTDDTHVVYERPESADSIDDAVEAYMCSPRLSQKIRHPQTGRIISFSEVGDSEGSAVFCCVGMGLTRYITAFYDELALTLKLRLITPDRPGIGDSEPYADGTATPLSWPDDVYAICQALKITKFSILAHSAGAIYALATALRMPQHIRGRIHLLAPWIPPSQMSVFGSSAQTPLPPTNAIPTSQRILRALPTPILKAANSSFMSATSSSITSSLPKTPKRKRKSNANLAKEREKDAHKNQPLPTDNKENLAAAIPGPPRPKDQPNLEDIDQMWLQGARSNAAVDGQKKPPSGIGHTSYDGRDSALLAAAADAIADRERQAIYDSRLTQAIWELATTGANPAVDLLICLERRHTIGFRYVDITRPVVIHHGSRDTRVPVDNVRWLGKTMRRCEVRVLEGEEHGLMASASVMGGILMEISKEWEDWSRLTGASSRGATRDERGRRGTLGVAR